MDVFSPLKNNLPELEELHLQFEYTNHSQPQPEGIDIFWNAPKLHRVTISGFFHYPIADMKLPWAQLTHFSLKDDGESIIDLRALLQSAPNLLEVDWPLSQPVRTNSQVNPSMTVQHPHVRDLSVFLYSDPGSSFDSFSLPSLRKLSIKTSRQFEDLPYKFGLFISRNCQALESFQLIADLTNPSELIACLKDLPALSDLTLTISGRMIKCEEMKKLLQSLSYTRRVPVILPALKRITVELQIPLKDGNVGTKFISMIESRCQASNLSRHSKQVKSTSVNQPYISRMRWASLTIHHDARTLDLTATDNRRLQNLRAQGLAVQVYFKR
jgi:hypothetical protein